MISIYDLVLMEVLIGVVAACGRAERETASSTGSSSEASTRLA